MGEIQYEERNGRLDRIWGWELRAGMGETDVSLGDALVGLSMTTTHIEGICFGIRRYESHLSLMVSWGSGKM